MTGVVDHPQMTGRPAPGELCRVSGRFKRVVAWMSWPDPERGPEEPVSLWDSSAVFGCSVALAESKDARARDDPTRCYALLLCPVGALWFRADLLEAVQVDGDLGKI